MSSSLRPCIDVFALPQKSNMAVTESNPDPKVRKLSIVFNDSATSQLNLWACDLNVTDSKKTFFPPDYSRESLRYDYPKKCPKILYGVNLWLKLFNFFLFRPRFIRTNLKPVYQFIAFDSHQISLNYNQMDQILSNLPARGVWSFES